MKIKTIKLAIIILFLAGFSACIKDETTAPNPVSSTNIPYIYYVDTAKIYSTDLSGNNKKLIVGMDTTNINSYITGVTTTTDGGKIYFRHVISGSAQSIKQYVVNIDGTGLTALKTLPYTNTYYGYTKLTSDNKLTFFQNVFTPPSTYTNTVQSLTVDGSTQATIGTIPSGFTSSLTQFGRTKNNFLAVNYTGTGPVWYAGSLNANVEPQSPRSLPVGATNAILSDDGKKVAYIKVINSTTLEIYAYDIATEAATLVTTYTIPITGGTSLSVETNLAWVDGTNKVMVYTGLFTSPRGAATDYIKCSIYTIGSATTPVVYNVIGDGILEIF